MRVTKWGEFGILCSLFLAERYRSAIFRSGDEKSGASVNATEIAEARSIPIQYTHQILQRLKKGGIILSERGPKGGYKLSKDPADITLKDVLIAAEGHTFEVICETNPVYGEECGTHPLCALRGVWSNVKTSVDQVLDSYSLEDLATQQEKLMNASEEFITLSRTQTPESSEVGS